MFDLYSYGTKEITCLLFLSRQWTQRSLLKKNILKRCPSAVQVIKVNFAQKKTQVWQIKLFFMYANLKYLPRWNFWLGFTTIQIEGTVNKDAFYLEYKEATGGSAVAAEAPERTYILHESKGKLVKTLKPIFFINKFISVLGEKCKTGEKCSNPKEVTANADGVIAPIVVTLTTALTVCFI